jgi:hypothetical protein
MMDDKFRKVHYTIRNIYDLRQALLRMESQGIDLGRIKSIYYSMMQVSDPEKIGNEQTFKDATIYGYDLPFEIDKGPYIEDLEEARQEALCLLKWIEGREELSLNYIAFSNSEGFHLPCRVAWQFPKRRRERLKFLIGKQKLYKDSLLSLGIKADVDVIDYSRVLKLPSGIINPETGYMTHIISKRMLKKPIEEILSHIPCHDNGMRPSIGRKPEMTEEDRAGKARYISPPFKRDGNAYEQGRTLHSQIFISNKVFGIKDRYVPLFRWSNIGEKSVRNILKKTMKRFELSDTLLIKDMTGYYAISFKTTSSARIEKILRYAKSDNLKEFQRNGIARMPVSKRLKEGKEVSDVMLLEDIKGSNDAFMSRPHTEFLNKVFRLNKTFANMHGNGLKTTTTKISGRE